MRRRAESSVPQFALRSDEVRTPVLSVSFRVSAGRTPTHELFSLPFTTATFSGGTWGFTMARDTRTFTLPPIAANGGWPGVRSATPGATVKPRRGFGSNQQPMRPPEAAGALEPAFSDRLAGRGGGNRRARPERRIAISRAAADNGKAGRMVDRRRRNPLVPSKLPLAVGVPKRRGEFPPPAAGPHALRKPRP